jgi:hypothetical protein
MAPHDNTQSESFSESSADAHHQNVNSCGILKRKSQVESETNLYQETKSLKSKSVQWSTVDVRFHEIKLGDSSSVSCGPPLTISWEAFHSERLSLQDFEEIREPRCCRDELILSASDRESILRNAGYTLIVKPKEPTKPKQTQAQQQQKPKKRNFFSNLFASKKIIKEQPKGSPQLQKLQQKLRPLRKQ